MNTKTSITAALVADAIEANVNNFYAGLYPVEDFRRLNRALWDLSTAVSVDVCGEFLRREKGGQS